jgi:hypothetical protein
MHLLGPGKPTRLHDRTRLGSHCERFGGTLKVVGDRRALRSFLVARRSSTGGLKPDPLSSSCIPLWDQDFGPFGYSDCPSTRVASTGFRRHPVGIYLFCPFNFSSRRHSLASFSLNFPPLHLLQLPLILAAASYPSELCFPQRNSFVPS